MVTDILYQIGILLAIILIGYRLYKDSSPGKDLLKILGIAILVLWFFQFLEYQFPSIQVQDTITADKYYNTTFTKRDKMQEDYHLYQVSDSIRRFIPPTIKEPVLIVFPEEFMKQLKWYSAAYWQRRLRYRNYRVPMDFIIVDPKGQFHDFYENMLLSTMTYRKNISSTPVIPRDILKKYFFILYIRPEPESLPPGFQEWRKTDYVLILKKENP